MKDIFLIGLNHKTAPVEVRECLAFSADDTATAIQQLNGLPSIKETVLFSTCNRIEMLIAAHDAEPAVAAAKQFMADFKNVALADFETALYLHQGDEAVRHVFRVGASLDSMMVGEPQILGQIKAAYRLATVQKTSGVVLNRLLHRTFFVAKRIRTETGIGGHAVSISYAAIELARKIFGALDGKQVLLIGAGEMAELAVEHLIRNRAGTIFVANRTFERGVELAAKFDGTAIRFEEIADTVPAVDIVISSTGAPDFVITRPMVKPMMRGRRNRPIFFIDIAVPRDIDPQINRINNAYVYDIDDLKGVVDENIDDRQREAVKAERIIDEAVIRFRQWYQSLSVVPTIVAMRGKATAMARAEVEKTLHHLHHLSEADRRTIAKMADAVVNKILHEPTRYLKSNGCYGDKSVSLDIARKLFKLDD